MFKCHRRIHQAAVAMLVCLLANSAAAGEEKTIAKWTGGGQAVGKLLAPTDEPEPKHEGKLAPPLIVALQPKSRRIKEQTAAFETPTHGEFEGAEQLATPLFVASNPNSTSNNATNAGSPEATPVFWAGDHLQQSERIQKALREPLNNLGFRFENTPLAEVVNFVRDEYDIEVQIDVAALENVAMPPDEPVHANLRGISLGAALRILLRQLELTYVISDEVLLITSEEEALTRLQVAVYPVGDIVASKQVDPANNDAGHKTDKQPSSDMDGLVDAILSTIASDTWVEKGGPEAEIRVVQPGLLIVSQTQDVHEEISKLLAAIRKAKQHPYAIPYQVDSIDHADPPPAPTPAPEPESNEE